MGIRICLYLTIPGCDASFTDMFGPDEGMDKKSHTIFLRENLNVDLTNLR